MKKNIYASATILLLAVLPGCRKDPPIIHDDPDPIDLTGLVNKCDFETRMIPFIPQKGSAVSFEVVQNPKVSANNPSSHCARVLTAGGKKEFIYCEPVNKCFDFTHFPPVFKIRVLAPEAGLRVSMKLEPRKQLADDGVSPFQIENVKTVKSGEWEWLTFDFRPFSPMSNAYQKIVLFFDYFGTSSGTAWYFDDIYVPDDDLADICLFKRYEKNPIFAPHNSKPYNWHDAHMANAAVLSPSESPDGNWWCYLRGTGHIPYFCDQIGLYKQNTDKFNPFGPWTEHYANPVLPVGESGTFDDGFLLGTSPVVGKDGVVYVYYNGKPRDKSTHGVCCRYSTDGGYTFDGKLSAPLYVGHGCSSAIYHNGKYYMYHGGGDVCELYVTVTENPLSFDPPAETFKTLSVGQPGDFDYNAINGSLVFRLDGVDKWFSTYQGSASQYDYPDRFGIAMSDDLIHWEKVRNEQPLFSRGSLGEWDQGGIWFGEIFEHKDMLYLYYEGWGHKGIVADRDAKYYSEGHSSVGAASVSKEEFLKWCGLK